MDIPSQLYRETKIYSITDFKLDGSMLYDAFPAETNGIVICFSSSEKELNTSEKELLGKILSAVKVDILKTALVNKHFTSDFSFKKMEEKFGVKRVLVFGTDFLQLFKNAQVQKNGLFYLGEMKIIITENLSVLLGSDAEKKVLWAGMKELFV